ncbi:alpha subunit of ribonucleoside-diphosphate reductase [Gilbertella persicaria]|uniref:alpha subunit of ribonucleoside-diphosphate reductase n=1 Tax=Gilbertella persicaria TaxID=101096 RepID=UPI00221F84FB|nr:alpha subunit of ribonucleoside-diphosphate reductase [Gilbertella persicaria]KAI8054186.1 alpha subunit of ribonucleoside-diphosphate reductase [Gilbertella persicaria]
MYPGITTVQLDNLAAEIAANMTDIHPDYAILAARISISNLQKETHEKFSQVMQELYDNKHPKSGLPNPIISKSFLDLVLKHAEKIDAAIDYQRDFNLTYFGFKTLEQNYLLKLGNKIVERPQHLLMRVALAIHGENLDSAFTTYDYTSRLLFSFAPATLLNAGTNSGQLSSAFEVQMKDDSIEGIYDTVATCARVAKSSGSVGMSFQKIRASGSYIAGTNGTSNGIIPMLRVFNDAARFITPGAKKVKGTYSVYLEPWHPDIFEFIDLSKHNGEENLRARHLLLGLWIPDIFMKRVEENGEWSLMCPNECPGLDTSFGKAFEERYLEYERLGKVRKTVPAQKLWFSLLDAQMESGMPFMCYKDAANEKSNQKNLGVISGSSLHPATMQYADSEEIGSANVASVSLPKCVNQDHTFNFDILQDIVKVAIKNLDKMIDVNKYALEEAKKGGFAHRGVALGVQGLADVFLRMQHPFDSLEARQLNKDIFETIYFAALQASNELAQQSGPYPSYKDSPASQGILQHDLWQVDDSDRLDWAGLRASIKSHGIRNSVLLAIMPTTPISQILGNNDSIEPSQSMVFVHRGTTGEIQSVNPYLLKHLTERGLWDPKMKDMLIRANGSIQKIPSIPEDLKNLFKTVWELSQRAIIDMAVDRAAFVDQSQSLNLFSVDPNYSRMSSMHFYSWKKGLKTGMQFLKSNPSDTTRLVVSQETKETVEEEVENVTDGMTAIACSLDNPDACVSCSG